MADDHLKGIETEILFDITAIDRDSAGAAGIDLDAGDRGLSTAGAVQIGLFRLIHIPDNVIVINASKATLSGKKLEQKMYRTHSGWVGGLKETKYKDMMEKKPELAMRVAVRGMMPRNVITKDSLKRLHVYAGETHEQQAQKPELYAE